MPEHAAEAVKESFAHVHACIACMHACMYVCMQVGR